MYRSDSGSVHGSPNGVKVKSIFYRPCSYCMDCRLSTAQSNAIRMVHESRYHSQNSFLTLTYSEDKLPSNGQLHYPDVVNFVKNLRQRISYHSKKYKLSTPDIRFYRVGEYGSDFKRPHYHMILFGYDFSDPITYLGVRNTRTSPVRTGDRLYYKSSFATDLWSNGFVDIVNVDMATCQYAAKYVTKKLKNSEYSDLDLVPERSSCSKGYTYPKNHPLAGFRKSFPIGHRWISEFFEDVYPHDYVVLDGKKYPPPRSYDEWLEKNKPSLWSQVKNARDIRAADIHPDLDLLYRSHEVRRQKQRMFLRDGVSPNFKNDDEQLRRQQLALYELKGKI